MTPSDFPTRLRAFAEVIVRVGLNLQRGQRLLIAEPYELQGVARTAGPIVEAIKTAAGCATEVIWGDATRLREFAHKKDWSGFTRLVAENAVKMGASVRRGDALLLLQGSETNLMHGIPSDRVAELRRIAWDHYGPIARQLLAGATQWTVAPAPSPTWAEAVFADLPGEQRLAALWDTVFESLRIPQGSETSAQAPESPVATWQTHLLALQRHRDELNRRRLRTLHYRSPGTDLTIQLPAQHTWCTACLTTAAGVPFVANLPTEELFTVPHRDSAEGKLRVTRPINYGGAVIDGIELEFRRGEVVNCTAKNGDSLLRQLLSTDEGACRLGEVAVVITNLADLAVPGSRSPIAACSAWHESGRLYYHPLLDENASDHVALGESYGFCLRSPNVAAANHSLIHVDLSLNAGRIFGPR